MNPILMDSHMWKMGKMDSDLKDKNDAKDHANQPTDKDGDSTDQNVDKNDHDADDDKDKALKVEMCDHGDLYGNQINYQTSGNDD